MRKFGAEIVGRTFKKGRVLFMVVGIEPYPEERIKPQFKDRLMRLEPGKLVAVPFRGTLIPNITVPGGVARLTKVACGKALLTRPKDISEALGANTAYRAYGISHVA